MGFFDIFRRAPAIREASALADFIDDNAAFLIQKGMYEYSRARAGHYAKVLLKEPEFLAAIEKARWQGYPLGLAMVSEMAEKVVNPVAGDDRRAGIEAIADLVLSVFDRYPVPAPIGAPAWANERIELSRRLEQIGLHPPKPVKDMPVPYTQTYFDLMPIHEKLRGRDFPTTRNYLRAQLCNIHEEFVQRLDPPAVTRSFGHARVA
jgi:hypothetical protein